ncbi:MAG TPA: haloalkane dehalogenase [Mycobacteriales bacterium]|nr:haloalkane dehalogenase [Mycobacteriales bacterium]
MTALRTPDEQFASLPGFPFEPQYATTSDGLRVHYLDEGPRDAKPVLLLHGEPSWSYLYRKVIPVLVESGHRCIAPDLVGFGRSDKPSDQADYSYQRLVDWTSDVVFDQLDLRDITLFGQDWGGLVGLRLVAAQPERFARVVVANTGLPTGEGKPTEAFLNWQSFAKQAKEFPVGRIVSGGCATPMDEAVIAAYDAPFPDDSYKAGPRALPSLVPTAPDDPAHDANTRAWEVLHKFERPLLCAFSDSDPITKGGERAFIGRVPGADNQPHTTIVGAGHFLQEDKGEELGRVIAEFVAKT